MQNWRNWSDALDLGSSVENDTYGLESLSSHKLPHGVTASTWDFGSHNSGSNPDAATK